MAAPNKEVSTLTRSLIEKGEKIFRETLPQKINQINKLLESELLNQQNETVVPAEKDITPQVPPPKANASKKKKRARLEADAAAPHSDSEVDSDDEAYDHAHDFNVPCNKAIIKTMELLRKEWKEAVEVVGAVKLSIQLRIPAIESGGQFHLQIMEECINELSRFEDVCYSYLESPSKYFQTRAKLAAKLSRHRTVFDYRQSLQEADALEYLNLKMAALELRNSYLIAYDLLAKNADKLQAKDNGFGSRMTI